MGQAARDFRAMGSTDWFRKNALVNAASVSRA
jgi:hypothetical protein